MKLLFDFLPILLFFITFKLYDIYVATAIAILTSCLQVGYLWYRHGRVENMHLITLGLIVVLGGATLLLHDETFIKWKVTAVNWAFALIFLGSQLIFKKNLIQKMMGDQLTLTSEKIWSRLNYSWVLFFLTMGLLNLYVAYQFDTDTWVNFKLFGMMGLTLIFVIAQAIYLSQYIVAEEDAPKPTPPETT